MLAVIHALVGIAIGKFFPQYLFLVPLAVLSHFLLDMIPHYDGKIDRQTFLDFGEYKSAKSTLTWQFLDHSLAIFLIFFLFFRIESNHIFLASLISVIPDMISIGYKTRLRKNKKYMGYLKFHMRIQKQSTLKTSLIIQSTIAILLMILLF